MVVTGQGDQETATCEGCFSVKPLLHILLGFRVSGLGFLGLDGVYVNFPKFSLHVLVTHKTM